MTLLYAIGGIALLVLLLLLSRINVAGPNAASRSASAAPSPSRA